MSYTLFTDLADRVTIPTGGITSTTVYRDDRAKVVVFGFDEGQELSEHTASVGALVYILEGRAQLTLDGAPHEVDPGACVHMPPMLPHAVLARTRLKMMLVLFTEAGQGR